MSEKEIINRWAEKNKSSLIKQYEAMNIKASGAWAKGLNYIVSKTPNGYNILYKAPRHHEFIISGRRPNKNQDREVLSKWVGWAGSTFLHNWVKNKGLSISPYAVAWKIAEQGFKIPNNYGNDGKLVERVFTPESFNELTTQLGKAVVEKSNIFKSWQ